MAWECVNSPFSRNKSFTSYDVYSSAILELNSSLTENYLIVWKKCIYLQKDMWIHLLQNVCVLIIQCSVLGHSFHFQFTSAFSLYPLFLKHAGGSEASREGGEAGAEGPRSSGDSDQFCEILGPGNKRIFGESNNRNRCSTWRTSGTKLSSFPIPILQKKKIALILIRHIGL